MLDLLSQFNAISVREAKLADVLGKLLSAKPQVVLDPTLLIPAEQWAKYIDKTPLVGGVFITLFAIPPNGFIRRYSSREKTLQNCDVLPKRYESSF